MIPIRLELHNFMAYGPNTVLDFSGTQLLCLSGENGAGKSTLLDAITWALWGKARARRDDELIRQGASDMRVVFVFKEGEQVYRVIRSRRLSRAKASTSSGTLEFFALKGVTAEGREEWAQLTETRIADTEARIAKVLRISYDTFISSAYLRQGRADEFTTKSPAERKALLAEILSLEAWAQYEERAKLAIQQVDAQLVRVREEVEHISDELKRLPEYEAALQRAEQQSQLATQEWQAALQRLHQLEREEAHARQLRKERDQLQHQLRSLEAQLATLAQQRSACEALINQQQQRLEQRAQIEQGYAALLELEARDAQFNEQLRSLNALHARKHKLELAISQARAKLENRCSALEAQLRDLAAQADTREWEQEAQTLRMQVAAASHAEERLRKLDEARAELQAGRQQLLAENEQLRQQGKELKARIAQLREIGAVCPTCGRPLSKAEREKILAEWHAQGQALNSAYERNRRQENGLLQQLEQLEVERRQALQQAQLLGELQNRLGKAEQRLALALQAAARLPALQAELHAAQQALAAKHYAAEHLAELESVHAQLAQLGYDASAHEATRIELQRLAIFRKEKEALDDAMRVIERERVRLEGLSQHEEMVHALHRQTSEMLEGAQRALQECEEALRDAERIRAHYQQAHQQYKAAQQERLVALQQVEACRNQEGRLKQFREEQVQLEKRRAMLQELREAFSKNGVPALVVESVLPKLEQFTNMLLGHLTDYRMSVRFDTQRLTQGGKPIETLEIRISDDLGERAYEMFSGGEAFRINLAIRLALSYVLAHRAGVSLQTLFIDEGFGTQDTQGRTRLLEVIRAIQDHFPCIVIITHLEELKDAFPVRAEVLKTPNGSEIKMIRT